MIRLISGFYLNACFAYLNRILIMLTKQIMIQYDTMHVTHEIEILYLLKL